MRIEQSDLVLPVTNYDGLLQNDDFRKHGKLFGGSCKRALVIGPSGCGKTNVLMSILLQSHGLRFENIYIYCKSLCQTKYNYLRSVLEPMTDIGYFEYENDEDIISPQEIKPNSIMIFDDVASCNQNIIKQYFSFGRHRNTDCFYLCQTYSAVPKHLIRDNVNLLILFPQDLLNLKHVYEDHINLDMDFQDFKNICYVCWQEPYDFIVIDKDSPRNKGRYRKGFDNFISL